MKIRLISMVLLAALAWGCEQAPGRNIPLHNLVTQESPLDLAPVELRVFLESGPDRLAVGESWELRVEAADPEGGEVDYVWQATSGTLSRVVGPYTRWTASGPVGRAEIEVRALDSAGNQVSGSFAVRVPDGTARGPVMDVRDSVGYYCSLAIDANDHPHIAFHNYTHPTLLYAVHDGSGWQIETIEGYGLDVGGAAGESASLDLDSNGNPHIAYQTRYAGDDSPSLNYATVTGGSWQLTTVDSSSDRGFFNVSLKVNPATQKPEILYASSTDETVTHAVCSGSCLQGSSWTTTVVYTETRGRAGTNNAYAGGFAIEADGTRHASIDARWQNTSYYDRSELLYLTRSGSSWGTPEILIPEDYSGDYYDDIDVTRLALDRNDQPLVLHYNGVYHRTGANLWNLSRVERSGMDGTSSYARFDIHCDRTRTPPASGMVWIASPHGGALELVQTNSRSYFEYTYVGSISSRADAQASVAVDSSGMGHMCWVDGGVLMYE